MIRPGKDTDKEPLKQLWKRCFSDTNRFIRFYFEKVYANEETLVYEENNQPVASLQMIPFRIKTGDSCQWGGYISGAMTHPDYRKKGYMTQLLAASFKTMLEKGYTYTFLIPQGDHLIDFYGKSGYEKAFPEYFTRRIYRAESKRSKNITIYTDFSAIDFPVLYSAYSHHLMEKTNAVLKSEPQFSNMLWDFFNENGVLFANDEGFAFADKRGKTTVLTEFFYRDEAIKTEFLQTVSAFLKKAIIYNDFSAPLTGYKGMIRSLDQSVTAMTDIYMGRMLE